MVDTALASPPETPHPAGRHQGLDQFRFIAFLGVFFIHFASQSAIYVRHPLYSLVFECLSFIGRAAVPFYFILAGYHLKLAPRGDWSCVRFYAMRLLMPFFIWAAIYLLYDMAENPAFPFGDLHHASFWLHLAFQGGPGFHLWFLTALFICIVFLQISIWFLSPTMMISIGALFFLAGLICAPYAPLTFGFACDTRDGPFFGLVFLCIGALIKPQLNTLSLRQGIAIFTAGLTLQSTEAFFLWRLYGQEWIGHNYLLGTLPMGIGLFVMAQNCFSSSPLLAQWGRLSLGLYAVHVLFLNIFMSAFNRTTLGGSLIIGAGVLICSIAFAHVASRSKCLKPLVA